MDHSPGDACLVDYATTHTILRDKKYFSNLILVLFKVQTISSPVELIKAPEELLLFRLMAPSFKLMMPFILISLIEIYLVSRIFAEMDITLKL